MNTRTPVQNDFSDWLVVSDIDGTLNNKFRRLPKRNYEMICRFVQVFHGHFTLASGRNVSSMRKAFSRLPIADTPAVLLNGAALYDYANEKMLRFHPIGEEGQALFRDVMQKFPALEAEVLTDSQVYTVREGLFAGIMRRADKLPYRQFKTADNLPTEHWGKVVFLGMPPLISQVKRYLLSIQEPGVNFMSSSISSFEMLAKGVHKGTGVLDIAELYGIDRAHTAAIGDYFNDYEMLKTVGLPACCGQAPKEMHQIAKFHACHCNKGAVADLLEYILYAYKEE